MPRVADEIVVRLDADLQPLRDRIETEGAEIGQASGAGGSGFFGRFAENLELRLQSFIASQINRLFARGLQALFGGRKKTTTTVSRSFKGGGSQFGPIQAGESHSSLGGSTTGAGATRSPAQTSSDLAAVLAQAQRNS